MIDNTYGQAALQEKMLEIFKFFISICDKYDLKYCLAAGTCLGAIRHEGFIPWDDDLDVFMPRYDYERLWSLADSINKESHYVLCRTTESKNYHHRVIQLADTETTFIHSRCVNEDIEHGVYIDIIPLDAQAPTGFGRAEQFVDAILFSVFNIQCEPEYNGGKMTSLIKVGTRAMLGAVRNPKTRYKIWRAAEKRMTNYNWAGAKKLIVLTSSFSELRKPFERSWFGERTAQFEGLTVSIPSKAEEYLTCFYGNYTELPDEEDRKPKHNTVFIDLENSYVVYRGQYYCTDAKQD